MILISGFKESFCDFLWIELLFEYYTPFTDFIDLIISVKVISIK